MSAKKRETGLELPPYTTRSGIELTRIMCETSHIGVGDWRLRSLPACSCKLRLDADWIPYTIVSVAADRDVARPASFAAFLAKMITHSVIMKSSKLFDYSCFGTKMSSNLL